MIAALVVRELCARSSALRTWRFAATIGAQRTSVAAAPERALLRQPAVLDRLLPSLIVASLAADALADEPPPVTAAPGDESGIVVAESGGGPSVARQVGRGVLWVPRGLLELVLLPVRAGVYVYDRYQLDDLYYRTFYNADRTFGIVPTIAYQTGFGLLAGAELVWKDAFGERENVDARATYGGNYQVRTDAYVDSGKRFDPVKLRVGGNFDRFGTLPFYGIGNSDLGPRPQMMIDPLVDSTAFETYYRYQELRAYLAADWRVIDDVRLLARGEVTDLKTGNPTSNTSLSSVYDPMSVVGFDRSLSHLYGELEARWDTRRIARETWETSTYTTGWLVRGFAGRVHELDAGFSDFTHYGIDLQDFVHLALGPRMLVFRLWGEGVTGNVSQIPFTELPYLGGDILRGYDFARFRDRVAAVGTAEYVWDLSRFTDAFVFVDAGRVYSSLDNLTLDNLRVGYGGGIALHGPSQFLLAGMLASSIDGGLVVTATLTPLWDETPRWR